MAVATQVFKGGYAPFCPHLDYHYVLQDEDDSLTVEDFYKYSMAWLEASDVVLVLPNSSTSKGVQAEIKRAKELKIPVIELSEHENPLYALAHDLVQLGSPIPTPNHPLNKQIGGDHYKTKIQPVEFAMANNYNYCQALSLRYIHRYKDKNGVEDIDKAIHTLELLKEIEYGK
jgi:hypothetical protein